MKKNSCQRGWLFVISGPSGSGKTTLAKEALKDRGLKRCLVKSVSLTTRPMRSAEKNHRDYVYISKKEFFALREAKKILEWTNYLGYYYATPRWLVSQQLSRGKSLILCLDLKGVFKIKRQFPDQAVAIFVRPASLAQLSVRISKRCHKTCAAEIKKRLALAEEEVKAADKFDHLIINDDLKQATKDLKTILLNYIRQRKKPACRCFREDAR